jgi:vancomycin resistance protein VanJ
MSDLTPTKPQTQENRFGWAVFAGLLFSVAVLTGSVVRLTVRDNYRLPAVAFYMLSPASITGFAALACLLFRRHRRQAARRMLIVTLAAGAWMGASMFYFHPQAARNGGTVRVFFWNVCRGQFGWDSIVTTIHKESPDVIVMAECARDLRPPGFLDDQFPAFPHVQFLPREVVVLSKFPIVDSLQHHHSWKGLYQQLQLSITDRTVNLLIADLPSPPWYRRDQPIGLLTEMASQYADTPAIIVGDMNTPVDSVYFAAIRRDFRNTFEAGGKGYHATWPNPLPAIAIDHMWVSRQIDVSACRILWTMHSDHRPIVADLLIQPAD